MSEEESPDAKEAEEKPAEVKLDEAMRKLSPEAAAALIEAAREDPRISKDLNQIDHHIDAVENAVIQGQKAAVQIDGNVSGVDPRFAAVAESVKASQMNKAPDTKHPFDDLLSHDLKGQLGGLAVQPSSEHSQTEALAAQQQVNQVADKGPGFSVSEMQSFSNKLA